MKNSVSIGGYNIHQVKLITNVNVRRIFFGVPTPIFNYQKIVYFRCDNLCNFIVHDWNLNFSLCNIAIEREIFLLKNKYHIHKIVIIVLSLLLIFSSFPIFLQHYNDIQSHYSDIVIIVLRRKAWISWISFRAICACAR